MKPKTVGRSGGQWPVQAQSICAGVGPGSILLTQSGETLVEDIVPGDRIITRDCGLVAVDNIRKHHVTTHTVRILAGSLGDTRPDRDVVMPAEQELLVRDWRAQALFGAAQAMVPVRSLVDGEFITHDGVRTLTLYQLCFDAPHVIYVDGLELAAQLSSTPQSNAA
ncbi:hypothetical protein G5B38_07195 [Pseudohalocynthiibacter aestuariivivens]|nr:Hint domain-containing protein [Pseudohalocynthiibacter aestuariivivens]QIE45326.1 hypothetical protein G5B38_07195 [Pseudohalocynthiibacter aestuariivivens]